MHPKIRRHKKLNLMEKRKRSRRLTHLRIKQHLKLRQMVLRNKKKKLLKRRRKKSQQRHLRLDS